MNNEVQISPMSFAQQRLWFLHQLEPENPAYNLTSAVRLIGQLDARVLQRCLSEIIKRHDSLRTTFSVVDGQPMQVIAPNMNLALSIVDRFVMPDREQEVEVQRLATEEAQRPFDITQRPLIRATLLRLADENNVLLMTLHSIVCDEPSMRVLFRELSILYAAISDEKPSPLPEVPIQYPEFARRQRLSLQNDGIDKEISYWKQQLSDASFVLDLPTDWPRPMKQTHGGAIESLKLPASLSASLKALSNQEGVTLYVTLLSAFQTLLHRYTGQDDVIVGSVSENGNQFDTEKIIGLFSNALVLRSDLSGTPTFREVLHRVRDVTLGACSHRGVPFEKLVEELQPVRDTSRSPLFQVMFQLRTRAMESVELPGLKVEEFTFDRGVAKHDLSLDVMEEPDGLHCEFEYSTDLFDRGTIARMAGHFQTLLEGIVGNPDQSISDLPLLTQVEQHQVLVEWNKPDVALESEGFFHNVIEAQVERTPDAVAVVFEGECMTYKELNNRANQVAHYLLEKSVGPEVPVGICMEHSLELLVGVLGILKSGGACVPMDPAYPEDRLAFMLEDTQVSVILTQDRLLKELPKNGANKICLDTEWDIFNRESIESPVSGVMEENLAFVFYTSGSMGRPKAVMWSHGRRQKKSNLQVDETDRYLLKASTGFTLLLLEIRQPLQSGARLIIARPGGDYDSTYLAKLVVEHEITVVCFVPSMLSVFLEEPEVGSCTSLKYVVCIGEALSVELQQRFFNRLPADLKVVYGTTEAPGATFFECKRGNDVSRRGGVSIGRRNVNRQIYVLDSHLQMNPISVPGELCVGGGTARGYLNCPDLTAEKFIPNPFSDEPGSRLYRTGDLARYQPDGNLEFLGRIDNQVQVRGIRIELGEIESVLLQSPSIREAVVIAREDVPGDKRLVAYIVAQQSPPSIRELRLFLRERLPDYMVPSRFVFLNALPLTRNGKVDVKSLPVPEKTSKDLEKTFVAAQDALEMQLTKIWEDILDVRPIGVRDDFFELGGHSLLAVRLFSSIEEVVGLNLPLATLFQAPTIELLASVIRNKEWSAPWSSLVAIHPGGSKPPLFLMHSHGGNVLEYYPLAHRLGEDQPVYALQARGLDGNMIRHLRVEEMATHYLREIRTLQSKGPYYLGGFCFGGLLALEAAQQLQACGEKVNLLAMIQCTVPGYHKNQRRTSIVSRMLLRVAKRAELEMDNLSVLERRARFFYLLERIRRAKDVAQAIITMRLEPVLSGLNLGNGHRSLTYILELLSKEHEEALRNYVPRPYDGAVALFPASKQLRGIEFDPSLGWGDLINGGLSIYEVHGHQQNILKEPNVCTLAEKLKACIDAISRTE